MPKQRALFQHVLITRAEALLKLRNSMLATFTAEQLLKASDPAPYWNRLRNYEIEDRLTEHFGVEHVVSELCPFNDVYCRYGELNGLDEDK